MPKKNRAVSTVRREGAVWEYSTPNISGFPKLQQTILAVCADEVLVRVVGDADHILLMDLRREEGREQHPVV